MGVVPSLTVVISTEKSVTRSKNRPTAKYTARKSSRITNTVRPKKGGPRAKNPAVRKIEYAAAASNNNCRKNTGHMLAVCI